MMERRHLVVASVPAFGLSLAGCLDGSDSSTEDSRSPPIHVDNETDSSVAVTVTITTDSDSAVDRSNTVEPDDRWTIDDGFAEFDEGVCTVSIVADELTAEETVGCGSTSLGAIWATVSPNEISTEIGHV